MEEVRQKLTPAERALLSDLWENKDLIHSLQSALSHRQLNLAQTSAVLATDFSQVMRFRGSIEENAWFMTFLKHNFKEGQKARQKAEEVSGK